MVLAANMEEVTMSHVKRVTKLKQLPALAIGSYIWDCFRGFLDGGYPLVGVPSLVDCIKCSKNGGSCAS